MASQTSIPAHQSAAALAGAWKLQPGRALTLRPREPGHLRVARGRLWATSDGPHTGPLNDQGDRILRMGDALTLRAGERLLIESWDGDRPAYFSWDPSPVAKRRPIDTRELVQSLEDIRLALALGVTSLGRLLLAVLGLAWECAGGGRRSGVSERAFNAN